MKYYSITIQVDFNNPRQVPSLPNSNDMWNSFGYFQTFYCTAQSIESAKKLVHQYYLENENDLSTCQFSFDHVTWLRFLTALEDLTGGYDSDLTHEMFARRDKIGIWFAGKKEYFGSEEDGTASMFIEEYDESDDERWGIYDGQCYACDNYGPIDDMLLCHQCAQKLERDLIRQRDWDYSASAFGLTHELREKLRHDIIKKYGSAFELIAPSTKKGKKRKKSKRRHKRK